MATAHHCTTVKGQILPCDHSDEKRVGVLGVDFIDVSRLHEYYTIPFIDAKYPPHAKFVLKGFATHDFAIYIFKYPATFSPTVQPICLPDSMERFDNKEVVAAGWGLYAPPNVSTSQSKILRSVKLKVDDKRYNHFNMFGTKLEKNSVGWFKDACSGDSGSPLMYKDEKKGGYVIIGTAFGQGYDCKKDKVLLLEKSDNGLWNRVSQWIYWIKSLMEDYEENQCMPE